MSETHTMEMLAFDDDGEPTCQAIKPKQWIELVGHNLPMEYIDTLAQYIETLGLEHTGSGIYPSGARWHGFKPKGKPNAKEK